MTQARHRRISILLIALLAATSSMSTAGEPPPPCTVGGGFVASGLDSRLEAAATARAIALGRSRGPAPSPFDLAAAMDIDPSVVNGADVHSLDPGGFPALLGSGPAGQAADVFLNGDLGVIIPREGESFAVLSSGIAGSDRFHTGTNGPVPEPGTDWALPGPDFNGQTTNDNAVLFLELVVPDGPGFLSFWYNFMSTEWPDFVLAGFNDSFIATLSDAVGTNQFVSQQVDQTNLQLGSTFFPVSDPLAEDTGYDIYVDDPTGVNDPIVAGPCPDAGLTNWQNTGAVAFTPYGCETPGGPASCISLELRVFDNGDGILDTQVLLDGLQISSLEAIDLNPSLTNNGLPLTNSSGDASQTAQMLEALISLNPFDYPRVVGATADGTSQVALRVGVDTGDPVQFAIDGSTADGVLYDPDLGLGANTTIVVNPVPALGPGAPFVAYAVLVPPPDFGGSATDGSRPITVDVTATVPGVGPQTTTNTLFLYRPPVVFVHGLWANPNVFALFGPANDPRYPVKVRADYASNSADSLADNVGALGVAILQANAQYRAQSVASTQVDVVGHGTGGILPRLHARDHPADPNNFQEGDLHKIITINTPHEGTNLMTELANLLSTPLGTLASNVYDLLGLPLFGTTGSIVPDLLPVAGSLVCNLPTTPVPGSALIGTGGSLTLTPMTDSAPLSSTSAIPMKNLYFFLDLFHPAPVPPWTPDSLFQLDNLGHDMFSHEQRQDGEIPPGARTAVLGADSVHYGNFFSAPVGVLANTAAANEVHDLLTGSLSTSRWGAFGSAPAGNCPAPPPGFAELPNLLSDLPPGGLPNLAILSPTPGTLVNAGDTIQVVVDPNPAITPIQVVALGEGAFGVDNAAPWEVNLEIPLTAAGPYEIQALATDAAGTFYQSATVTLDVTSSATLNAIDVSPDEPILSGVGSQVQLLVTGDYSDGIPRDVTATSTFLSINTDIVTVDANGLVTARGLGITTVVVNNGAHQTSATVTVVQDPGFMFGDGFESGDTSGWQ